MTSDFVSSRYYYTFGDHPPGVRVAPGDELRIICPDSDNMLSNGELLSAEQRQRGDGLFHGNPMAGPIYIEGAEPGDSVTVEILDIELDRDFGQTGLAPGHGLLPVHMLTKPKAGQPQQHVPHHLYKWRIDAPAGTATLQNPLGNKPITVRLNPFVGCIGVCPRWGQGVSTLFAGTHGGNMDVPLIAPGTTLHLPVYQPGALVMMGDLHAGQGQGEIIGGGIETSGNIRARFGLRKGIDIPGPRLQSDTQLATIATDGDLRAAIQLAYSQLVDWVADLLEMNRFDAYHLVSQTAGVVVGNLITSPYSVAAVIENAVIDQAVNSSQDR